MNASAISPAGIPSPTEPAVAAAIDRWVSAAGDDPAGALAAVVAVVAAARSVRVALSVDGAAIRPDPAVLAVAVPTPVLERAGPWLAGFVREALQSPLSRRGRGVHHTSPAMAAGLVEFVECIAPLTDATFVADPAVGGGVFLLAACERMSGTRADRVARVAGIDIDPLAVAVTEASLAIWADGAMPRPGSIRVGDGLGRSGFDPLPHLVIGNPPFLSQLRRRTTRDGARRQALHDRWPEVGGYVDDAAAFLLAGVDAVAEGGIVALVQPASFLSARDAAPVREKLQREGALVGLWIDGDRQFDAAVDTVAIVVERGASPGPVVRARGVPPVPCAPHTGQLVGATWAPLLLHDSAVLDPADVHRGSTVADVCRVTAGFRDQFYGLRGAVREDPECRYRLITSGLIDPLECRWGATSCRFDQTAWSHPGVDPTAVAATIEGWIAQRLVPKLLVASQTKTIEVIVDLDGRLVPCTPVVSIEPSVGAPSLAHLAAALTSPVASALLLADAAGSALSRDAMRVSAATIGSLPLPPEGARWDAAAAAVAALGPIPDRGDVVEVGRLAMEAYGLGDREDLLNWWQDRLPRR